MKKDSMAAKAHTLDINIQKAETKSRLFSK
jgi:hypothetical protein